MKGFTKENGSQCNERSGQLYQKQYFEHTRKGKTLKMSMQIPKGKEGLAAKTFHDWKRQLSDEAFEHILPLTVDQKKLLRSVLEQAFDGDERDKLRRKIDEIDRETGREKGNIDEAGEAVARALQKAVREAYKERGLPLYRVERLETELLNGRLEGDEEYTETEWDAWLEQQYAEEKEEANKILERHEEKRKGRAKKAIQQRYWKSPKQYHKKIYSTALKNGHLEQREIAALKKRDGKLATGSKEIADAMGEHIAMSEPYKMAEGDTTLCDEMPWLDEIQSEYLNYRPIALLDGLFKLYTAMLAGHLVKFGEINGIISEVQEGSRKDHNTLRQLTRVTNAIEDANISKQQLMACYVDFENAYGSVDHDRLVRTLEYLGVPAGLVGAIKDVKVGAHGYKHKYATDEDTLGPLRTATGAFVDDLVILTGGVDHMNCQLKKLEEFAKWSGLEVNKTKTVLTGVKHGYKAIDDEVFGRVRYTTRKGQKAKFPSLKPHETYKYLGMHLTMTGN
ncbi:hypothetical protein CYMTET_32168 [Cymbomonas tetramitiformis]|uniref:Reverse transcriptase domain-containing protein n=1 Tax=Cymbomonas tetramitiformis TaxID=36881 RepID=A0AAE0FFT6_9CHLO|nr:hypothetical protein CYMTET_32168 [Cymbomonas tetramitiformis]